MKADLHLAALLCLLAGCGTSTREVNSTARVGGQSSSKESATPRSQPAPQQRPRPVVYFSGGFTKTGSYPWTNGMTLKDGLDMAGGFSKWATGRLRLIRRDGSQEIYRLGPGRTLTNNPALEPEDLVLSRGHVDAF